MLHLLDVAADAAVGCTERLVVASARLHDLVADLRARLGTPRHCPACLVVAPRGDACACSPRPSFRGVRPSAPQDSRPPAAPRPPQGPPAGREADAYFDPLSGRWRAWTKEAQ